MTEQTQTSQADSVKRVTQNACEKSQTEFLAQSKFNTIPTYFIREAK